MNEGQTHWEGCEESHHDCALVKLRAAQERIAQLTAPGEYQEVIGWLKRQANAFMPGDDKFAYNLEHAATAIEQLQAQNAILREGRESDLKAAKRLAERADQAEARVRELEPDAERYRTVRAMIGEFPQSHWYIPSYGMVKTPEEFDAAVDRAARKEPT